MTLLRATRDTVGQMLKARVTRPSAACKHVVRGTPDCASSGHSSMRNAGSLMPPETSFAEPRQSSAQYLAPGAPPAVGIDGTGALRPLGRCGARRSMAVDWLSWNVAEGGRAYMPPRKVKAN